MAKAIDLVNNLGLDHVVDSLATFGVQVDMDDLAVIDFDEFLKRIVTACKEAANRPGVQSSPAEEEESEEVVQFSLAGHHAEIRKPISTKKAVDRFFEMLPPRPQW